MDPSTITMTTGKFNGITALANGRGVIAALAMDQRGSLRRSLEKATGRAVAAAELQSFKALVTTDATHGCRARQPGFISGAYDSVGCQVGRLKLKLYIAPYRTRDVPLR